MLSWALATLAQVIPFDDGGDAPAKVAPARPMSFHDLQHGFQDWNDGKTDNSARNGLLLIVAIVIVAALVVHFCIVWRNRGKPDSVRRLGFELARGVAFPFGSRVMLFWVACSTKTPMGMMLISRHHFEKAIAAWRGHHTFVPLRAWGAGRLQALASDLFDEGPAAVKA